MKSIANALFAVGGIVVAACSGDSTAPFDNLSGQGGLAGSADGGLPDSSAGGAGGASGAGGISGAGGNVGGNAGEGGHAGQGGSAGQAGAGAAGAGGGSCAQETVPGKPAPVDVYVLLDATASMMGSSGTAVVWPAVTQALVSWLNDAASEGMSVGLGFLPAKPPPGFHVPGSCTTSTDCPGSTGPCQAAASGLPLTCLHACATAQDCGMYGPCTTLMQNKVCNGAMVPDVSCDPADYTTAAVAIGALPDNKSALVAAINGMSPEGAATPTEPALVGALSHAHGWAASHPGHLVHVLMATDGMPNNCTYNSIDGAAQSAALAYGDTPSVSTYVLELGAQSDLTPIAQAGGTGFSYKADASQVSAQLQAIVAKMRADARCRLQIPTPQVGVLQYDKVNVLLTAPGQPDTIVAYSGSASQCSATMGGWYYDVDPKNGTPSLILLCPYTCAAAQQPGASTIVALGCKTMGQ